MSQRLLREGIVFICPECAEEDSISIYKYGKWVRIDAEALYEILLKCHKIEARFCDLCDEEYPLGHC